MSWNIVLHSKYFHLYLTFIVLDYIYVVCLVYPYHIYIVTQQGIQYLLFFVHVGDDSNFIQMVNSILYSTLKTKWNV